MILITGATGFVASSFINYIIDKKKYHQNQLVLLSSVKNNRYKTILHNNYKFTKQDFIDNNVIDIDILIHFGAFTPKEGIEANNIEGCNSNIINTINLLDNLPNFPKKIIFISTLDVYGDSDMPIDELKICNPSTLYGQSKLYTEKIITNWCNKNKCVHQILRLGHIYGKGEEKYKKLIPEVIRSIYKNQEVNLFTNGNEKRSFIHILDCVKAIAKAIELDEYIEEVNIVSEKSYSINQIVAKLVSFIKDEVKINRTQILGKDIVFNNQKMKKYLVSEEVDIDFGLYEEFLSFKNLI